MKYLERKNFDFVSKALAEDTFEVVKFSGSEAISKPYEFTVTMSAEDPDIDLKTVLRNPATLMIMREDEKIPIHGVPAVFEQLHEANRRVFYRAVLVPKLWYLDLYRDNRLFLDKTVPQIIEEVLKTAGLTTQDYELKFTRSYTPWEYLCQYRESNLDFISRWMEREGIYYFFKQQENSEKLVITDNLSVHEDVKGDSKISYSPVSGLIPEDREVVTAFVSRQRALPKKVILKDYNYRKPSLGVQAEANVDPNGREEVYVYGEHFKDPSQGKELATIRAQEFLCRETMYLGEGTAPCLAPGSLFELAEHYRSSCNRKFLVTEVKHQGIGTGLLLAGVEQSLAEREMQPGYSNQFVCIPSDIQFRPERKTPRPRFNGTMNAVVDAAGDGKYAELDDQGRYKVVLPFDLSGRKDGKASRYIRMAQPYSGSEYGMHFPLHKGAEVLLSFVDGDPDRPVISGTVPNPANKSPVTADNQARSIMRDSAGNEMIFDTETGKEHIWFYSPHHNSSISIGKSVNLCTDSNLDSVAGGVCNEWVGGFKTETVLGSKSEFLVGFGTEIAAASVLQASLGWTTSYSLNRKVDYCEFDDVSLDVDDYYKEIGDCGLIDAKNLLQLEAGNANSRNCRIKMAGGAIAIENFNDIPRPDNKRRKMGVRALFGSAVIAAIASAYQAIQVPKAAKREEDAKETGNMVNTIVVGGVHTLLNAAAIAVNMLLKNLKVEEIAAETDVRTCKARIELKNQGAIEIANQREILVQSSNDSIRIYSHGGNVVLAAPEGWIFAKSRFKQRNFEIID